MLTIIALYHKSADNLPKPSGLLSSSIPSSAIEAANRAVRSINQEAAAKKRGPHSKLMKKQKPK